MRRHLIGLTAIVLALGAVAFWIWPPQGAMLQESEAACWRMSLVMGIWWLAYPQAVRLPGWLWFVVPLGIFLVLWRPKQVLFTIPFVLKWAIFLLPLIVLLILLKPRNKSRR
jgi:hypothetical protein